MVALLNKTEISNTAEKLEQKTYLMITSVLEKIVSLFTAVLLPSISLILYRL